MNKTVTITVILAFSIITLSGIATANSASCNTGGHANPHTYEAIYAGTDDCGRTNGAATVNSPAVIPDQNPIRQVTFN